MTGKNKTVTIRVPLELLELLDLYNKEERVDRSTGMRQWLYQAGEGTL